MSEYPKTEFVVIECPTCKGGVIVSICGLADGTATTGECLECVANVDYVVHRGA